MGSPVETNVRASKERAYMTREVFFPEGGRSRETNTGFEKPALHSQRPHDGSPYRLRDGQPRDRRVPANGLMSAMDAVRIFFHADNCLYVRTQLKEPTADRIMSHGVQLPDLLML